MKIFSLLFLILFFSINIHAQIETSSLKRIDFSELNSNGTPKKNDTEELDKTLKLPETPNFTSPNSSSGFNYDTKLDLKNFGTLNPIQMDFGVAPTVNKYLTNEQPNYLKKEKGIATYFQRNQNLGDIRTKSKFLILQFRDHSDVDGDVIRLIVNDEIVVHRSSLNNNFSEFKLNTEKDGFYKIDFMALNMGKYAPNTAQLKIIDDKFNVILNDKWALSTGFKATVVIIKE